MQLACPMWQTRHPTISLNDVKDWFSCIQDNTTNTLFNRLKEIMCIACTVMGDSIDNPRLVCVGLLACTFDNQAITINTLQHLVKKLFEEANNIMNNEVGEHKFNQANVSTLNIHSTSNVVACSNLLPHKNLLMGKKQIVFNDVGVNASYSGSLL